MMCSVRVLRVLAVLATAAVAVRGSRCGERGHVDELELGGVRGHGRRSGGAGRLLRACRAPGSCRSRAAARAPPRSPRSGWDSAAFAETSQGLEQIGTESDCTASGRATYGVWYELVPAASVPVKLKVFPGNRISANVTVNGQLVIVNLKNLTRKTSFTKRLFMSAPDVSSAEWIAEAPSACTSTGQCRTLPLANFGTVSFSSALALAAGHGGTIADAGWAATSIELRAFTGAVPSELSPDGGSFSVTWAAANS